ncbi:MAG: bacillithiol biosynthesis deacetylase BshB1 [Crocinitomicaceae bacterium]|nr:bacillithiol biosynthesis deacetylase BshB1 [Crocinitomicaceae bacterium]|tara:strand:+ start:3937 stop:4653 length:717 start_codon:yes stop_codon:yes gene_type:complete
MKLDILVLAAHPDDAELGCSGTILKHIKQGKKVGVVDFTRGELGTRGSAEIRDQEAADSSKILGLSARHNLRMADGFFEYTKENQLLIIEQVRRFQPDVILINAENDRHPDHGKASKLASDAIFLSGLRKVPTTWEGQEQEAWRPKSIYRYIQDYYVTPDLVVDVTDEWETKMKSVMAFKTQFYDPESDEPESPISSKEFLQQIEGRAIQYGRLIGAKYGEGFTTQRPVGVHNLLDLL